MNIELKAFQEIAATLLREDVEFARAEAVRGRPQAIVLSSPTGSGKTVTITALMERIYQGDDEHPPDPQATFLWLSDSPELNAQSYDKIIRQSSVFTVSRLVIVEPPFSQEYFEAGKIYFLNTQKLSKEGRLTKHGDGREYTIWQTIQNTSAAKPGSFYLILDEAHRGMMESTRARNLANSIVQRFIKGYPEASLQPVKLIIGMSATPERFNQLLQGTNYISRPHEISAEDVRESGLLKDKIILSYTDEKQPSDWSLLEAAVQRWNDFKKLWEAYCKTQNMEQVVKPALVLQVEDGTKNVLTHTNLNQLVEIVERVTGRLPERAWAHAFQEDRDIEAGGQKIRKIDASKIEDDPFVQVVLFKMSLSTGWDCPRAEVMMSFRKAKDHTSIAQLVGRMVRTPLARKVEGQEFLNTVSLFLPHYDNTGLQAILNKLNNPDPDTGLAVSVEDGSIYLPLSRAWGKEELFETLATLPTYRIERLGKTSNVKRLIKFARQLTMHDEIDRNALPEAKVLIVNLLEGELARLSKTKDFVGNMTANQEIQIREVAVRYGDWLDIPEGQKVTVKATPENIEDLFIASGRVLGEGLHLEFWKFRKDKLKPYRAKLELYGVLQEPGTLSKLEKACQERLDVLYQKHQDAIAKLPTGRQEQYRKIYFRSQKEPKAEPLIPSIDFPGKKTGQRWEKHLYSDENGQYHEDFERSSWEPDTLEAELAKPEVVGWLRNLPRKDWSLCVPYLMGDEIHSLYPDFIFFRKTEKKVVVDILDPHSTSFADALYKAKGLAEFAEKHGKNFGRIEIINKVEGILKRLDLNKKEIRDALMKLSEIPELENLYSDS